MKVDVQKILFIGPESKKEEFLTAFQRAGTVQFIGTKITAADLLHSEFQEVVQAIKLLQQHEAVQTPDVVIVDPLSYARDLLTLKQRLNDSKTELKAANELLETVAPFGTIPHDAIASIEETTPLRFRLWTATKKRDVAHECSDLILVSEDSHYQYFVSLTPEPFSLPAGLEAVPLTEKMEHLSSKRDDLKKEIADLEEAIKRRAPLTESLKKALIAGMNVTKRQKASDEARSELDNRLFAMAGWVPQTGVEEVQTLASSLDIFTNLLPTLPDEVPPTYLENTHARKIGEDLVSIYDTPAYTDKDPSAWVLVFFSLFFAMIIGDAGYGLVFLLTALFLQKKTYSSSSGVKRFVKLTAILAVACIAWGLLTNSFFAIKLSPENPLRSYSPLTYLVERQGQYHLDLQDGTYQHWVDLHNSVPPASLQQFLYESPSINIPPFYDDLADGTMLELALFIGSLHIVLSMCRYLGRNIANAGWLLCIFGGYMYFANFLHAPSLIYYLFGLNPALGASIGLQLIAGGFLFTAGLSIIKNGIADLFNVVMGGVSVFADILSYLRLYALGLSGAIVAGMVNGLADKMPFIIAILLIAISHAANIGLSIMGGVIHGLRLNFLEWYHYSFEGGGKPFSPLSLETY
jgi:V/A-type H+/Na+-transporting ATPase subunit I